jgi:tetratricopeptide (TPR) repeat protein
MVKVYVSSTILDLKPERQAVKEWLLAARHQAVDSYLPNSDTVRDSCLADIDSCDLYVLILGHRYGAQPAEQNPEGLSITHLEFRRAGESGIPRIALLRTSIPDVRDSDMGNPERAQLVLAFRQEVEREVRPAQFSDQRGLIQALSTGIQGELDKFRTSADQRGEAWLAAHMQDLARQFADHLAASALAPGMRPENLYLDLVVTERRPGVRQEITSEAELAASARPLVEVVEQARYPILLTGEGGAGKTASLLHMAARAADRVATDPTAPVPIYVNLARLTRLDDVPDLLQLIADSVPLLDDWSELSGLDILRNRRIVFLFDSLNEMPEHLQRNCVVILMRFIGKRRDGHGFLVASRPAPYLDQLQGPTQCRMFEILRLRSEQVRGFLQQLGLGSLYERMPAELRNLAGNPFMLLAIARTLAGAPGDALPRNRGKLYEQFVQGWMRNEQERRGATYHYERVKQPLLAHLAMRMTSLGQTSLALHRSLEEEVKGRLDEIYDQARRLGGMPGNWTVDGCLTEVIGDGLLRRSDTQLQFMHQSVQEYFTGLRFYQSDPVAFAEFTPRLAMERVSTYELPDVPSYRFVPPLLIMTGLLEDATTVVKALADRHPVLAAAAIASANRVDGAVVARLTKDWIDLLGHEDYHHRAVACACLVRMGRTSHHVIRKIIAMALSPEDGSWVARLALVQLNFDVVAREAVNQVLALADAEYAQRDSAIGDLLEELPAESLVPAVLERWRARHSDGDRRRLGRVLATVAEPARTEVVRRMSTGAVDPELLTEVDRALADAAPHNPFAFTAAMLREIMAKAARKFQDRVSEAVDAMRAMADTEVTSRLRSADSPVRAAAAQVSAQRKLAVTDILLESILTSDHSRIQVEFIAALLALQGTSATVAALVQESGESFRRVAVLPPELTPAPTASELPKSVMAAIDRLQPDSGDLSIVKRKVEGDVVVWSLSPSSWGTYRPLYELRVSPDGLEFRDCNIGARAVDILGQIDGDDSLIALRHAVEHGDPRVESLAVRALGRRRDPDLAGRLLARLRGDVSSDSVDAALEAFAMLGSRDALSLMQHLLVMTPGQWSDHHPVWGECPRSPGWSEAIHRVLVGLDADDEVRRALTDALDADDPLPRAAALAEYARWFAQEDLEPERQAMWRAPEQVRRLLDLALRDADDTVRAAAAKALERLKSDAVQRSLVTGLQDDVMAVRVAAGEALIRTNDPDLQSQVADAMVGVVHSDATQRLRRRACAALVAIPGRVEQFYQPIQAELVHGEPQRALELIEATIQLMPEDANLSWWRGHALRELGRLDHAAESYQRASELEETAAVIPRALAETFLQLYDVERAMEAARRSVELDPADADAYAILAWSSYKAGAIAESVAAARNALDLDPVHGTAMWVVLLCHLRRADLKAAQAAFHHAQRVRQLLPAEPDASFVTTVVDELASIRDVDVEMSGVLKEIHHALDPENERRSR